MPVIRVFDFETNGVDPEVSQICEYGYADFDLGAGTVGRPIGRLCKVELMPPEVRAVHHISAADTKDFPEFDPLELSGDGIDAYAAHNAEFELGFYSPPSPTICTYKAALRVWPDAPGHKNGVIFYWLLDQELIKPDLNLTQPSHRAGPDAYVTAHILKALFATGVSGADMVRWSKEPPLLPTCPIGQQRGEAWSAIDGGFLEWMLRQDSMEKDLKWNAQRELDRRRTAGGLNQEGE